MAFFILRETKAQILKDGAQPQERLLRLHLGVLLLFVLLLLVTCEFRSFILLMVTVKYLTEYYNEFQ